MDVLSGYDSDEVKLIVSDTDLIVDVINGISEEKKICSDVVVPTSETRYIRSNFPLNSRTAEQIKYGNLNLYSTEITPLSDVLVDGSEIYNLISLREIKQFTKLSSGDGSEKVEKELVRVIETADPVELDILPWSDLLTQLEEIVGEGTRREFERLIEAARVENVGALDDISVAIIAAAQSEAMLYDLGKWAEEVGLASKATFSRRKQNLEEEGLIYTEKVPVDVGRPRLRLMLSDDVSAVSVQGDELDIEREGEWGSSYSEEESSSTATSKEEITEDGRFGDEGLQILEKELKEAIRSN